MRFTFFMIVCAGAAACGGITDNTGDSGSDGGPDAPALLCNGDLCSAYCIHPSGTMCPTCTALPDGGTCPPDTMLQTSCPVGPAMPPGQYCVSYPTPDPPSCTPTIPSSCWDPSTPSHGSWGDVQCGAVPCGA